MRIPLDGKEWRILGSVPSQWEAWQVGTRELEGPGVQWIPAQVPGDVQSDLLDAGEIDDPFVDRNSRLAEWTSSRDWVYERRFDVPAACAGEGAVLLFEGVDYSCHVWLNGVHLGDHSGMYDAFEWDVGDSLRPGEVNRLVVVVDHAPMEPTQQGQLGRTSAVRLWKARFTYQWDFSTRLVPLGIWGGVTVVTHPGARLTGAWVRAVLSDAGDTGMIEARIGCAMTTRARLTVACTLSDPGGAIVARADAVSARGVETVLRMELDQPELWFPNGSGGQPLYDVQTVLRIDGAEVDRRSDRVGFRTLTMVPNQNAPEGALPYQVEVNGRPEFIRGWNWVPVSQLYGRTHEQEYRHLLAMARDAHCNLLRVWGGGLLERELFYDLCDEYGLLVWQEFIQSSSGLDNEPASDPDYLAYVEQQAVAMVRSRRNHPSLAVWTGGNELTTAGSQVDVASGRPITLEHPNIAVLAGVVAREAPGQCFLPSSPSGPTYIPSAGQTAEMHDIHGEWLFLGDHEHYRHYEEIDPLFHSEFGVDGVANLDLLERALTAPWRWPAGAANPVWRHHGAQWLDFRHVEALFGALDSLPELVNASQWLQAEGLRYAVEARRRREPRCSGVIPWQYNEPWPNAACTNAIDFFGHPKAAYWAVRHSYSSGLVSAQYRGLQWRPGEIAEWKVYRHGSSGAPIEWRVIDALTGNALAGGTFDVVDQGPVGTVAHAFDGAQVVVLELAEQGAPAPSQYFASSFATAPLQPLLRLPVAAVELTTSAGGTLVEVLGVPVLGMRIDAAEEHVASGCDQGYWMYLPPGRRVLANVARPARLSAWNLPAVELGGGALSEPGAFLSGMGAMPVGLRVPAPPLPEPH